MARRFRGRRQRTRWLWSGISTSGSVALEPAVSIVQILSPSQVATVADMRVERVIIDLNLQSTVGAAPPLVGAYLTVVPTDVDEVPAADALWSPLDSDIDATQKRPMWWRLFNMPNFDTDSGISASWMGTGCPAFYQNGSGEEITQAGLGGFMNAGQPFDIGVRRKLCGDQALVLVLQHFASSGGVNFNILARALVAVGKK